MRVRSLASLALMGLSVAFACDAGARDGNTADSPSTSGGPTTDAAAAAVEQACDTGDSDACTALVKMYQEDCDKGDMKSCTGLARMHFEGAYAPDDKDRAIELFELACGGGYSEACSN